MKKTLAILLVLTSLLALVSCGAKGSTPDTSAANKIVYGARYIRSEDISEPAEKQNYYVVYKDRIEFHSYYYSSLSETHKECTVTYKYTIMDEGTLAYFYHSDEPKNTVRHDRSGLLLFSENVLATTAGVLFVREDYAKNELPNFDK